jgi:dihydroorotate dehydrogenase (fumarate)
MDLTTRYLGFDLAHPFMPGASPMVDDLDTVRRLEDAGAAAFVMHSLFEEQLVGEEMAVHHFTEEPAHSFGEAMTYMPSPDEYRLGPHEYLEQLRKIKDAVNVPVFGSLNGTTPGGWLEYSQLIVDAGADALELNLYQVAADPELSGRDLESRSWEMVREVVSALDVPVAVKLSPFYSSLSHFAAQLDDIGVGGIVLFNRFYQADIDVEELEAQRSLQLSDSSELLLRLNWLGILSGQVKADLAVSGGVHTLLDAIKAIMTGAAAVQMVSALLERGPSYLGEMRRATAQWLEEHEYDSLHQMVGSMNLRRCPDPSAYTRANYLKILQGWGRHTVVKQA